MRRHFRLVALLALLLLGPRAALRAQENKPSEPKGGGEALCARAEQLEKTGDLVEAEAAFRTALQAYEAEQIQQPAAPSAAQGACHARNEIARLLLNMERFVEARDALAAALPTLHEAIGQYPQEPSFRLELSTFHSLSASCCLGGMKIDEAVANERERIHVLQALVQDFPKRVDVRQALVKAVLAHEATLRNLARQQESEAALEQAGQVARQFVKDFPAEPLALAMVAMTSNAQALFARELGREPARVVESMREAVQLVKDLKTKYPDQPKAWAELPRLYRNLARGLVYDNDTNDTAGARAALQAATSVEAELAKSGEGGRPDLKEPEDGVSAEANQTAAQDRAVKEAEERLHRHPNIPRYRYDLARAEMYLGLRLTNAGAVQDARVHLARSRELYTSLCQDFPDRAEYRAKKAVALVLCGMGEELDKQPGIGDALIKQGLELAEKLANDYPNVPRCRFDHAQMFVRVTMLKASRGDVAGMTSYLGAALGEMKKLTADFPRCAWYRRVLAQTLVAQGERLAEQDAGRAESLLREGVRQWAETASTFPALDEYRKSYGEACRSLGTFLKQHDKGAEAERVFGDAMKIHEQLVKDFPHEAQYAIALAADCFLLGVARENQKDLPAALTYYARAVASVETALRSQPEQREWLLRLQAAQRQRAFVLLALQRMPEYEQALQAAAAVGKCLEDPERGK